MQSLARDTGPTNKKLDKEMDDLHKLSDILVEFAKKLEAITMGDYDWSHKAMHYWSDRVREKCKMNKSYAIAHDLEHLYEGR